MRAAQGRDGLGTTYGSCRELRGGPGRGPGCFGVPPLYALPGMACWGSRSRAGVVCTVSLGPVTWSWVHPPHDLPGLPPPTGSSGTPLIARWATLGGCSLKKVVGHGLPCGEGWVWWAGR